jgi:hypothetical protein
MAEMLRVVKPSGPMLVGSIPDADREVTAHHLRLFGIDALDETGSTGAVAIIARPHSADAEGAKRMLADGNPVIALNPSAEFCAQFGVRVKPVADRAPSILRALQGSGRRWGRLRTLHPRAEFLPEDDAKRLEPLLVDEHGRAAWTWQDAGSTGMLFIGTEFAQDLIRYRQGDPSATSGAADRTAWGFAFERPVYLYEEQLAGEAPGERHADWWCWALREVLCRKGVAAGPIFPNDAPGVVVMTGDDDQAYLESYEAQLAALGPLPITYFLHPLTRHDAGSMQRIFAGHRVELGLHPDALEEPRRYAELFAEQARWFEKLVGRPAVSLRNHGFLNDGYWGHAPVWQANGFTMSSNLPGLDGRMLNGSLLPARLVLGGRVADHWSVLTAIGDGVVFGHGKQYADAGDVVRELGHKVKESGVPGAIVLNLHPQNIESTRGMHRAARDLVEDGFLAWTLGDLIDWFAKREPVRRSLSGTRERPEEWTSSGNWIAFGGND